MKGKQLKVMYKNEPYYKILQAISKFNDEISATKISTAIDSDSSKIIKQLKILINEKCVYKHGKLYGLTEHGKMTINLFEEYARLNMEEKFLEICYIDSQRREIVLKYTK